MTSKTMVSEDEFMDIIDQMRIAIPEEIKQAKKVQAERERMLAQTQEEAARILSLAKEDASHVMSESSIVKSAQERARQIELQARADADSVRQGADTYAAQVLTELQGRLDQIAAQISTLRSQVANGVDYIQEQQGDPDEVSSLE
jgi:dsDNA-specific endonuclease/ATPase MutS2